MNLELQTRSQFMSYNYVTMYMYYVASAGCQCRVCHVIVVYVYVYVDSGVACTYIACLKSINKKASITQDERIFFLSLSLSLDVFNPFAQRGHRVLHLYKAIRVHTL